MYMPYLHITHIVYMKNHVFHMDTDEIITGGLSHNFKILDSYSRSLTAQPLAVKRESLVEAYEHICNTYGKTQSQSKLSIAIT